MYGIFTYIGVVPEGSMGRHLCQSHGSCLGYIHTLHVASLHMPFESCAGGANSALLASVLVLVLGAGRWQVLVL